MIIDSYEAWYCYECQSLAYNYEECGLVCDCKAPWLFRNLMIDEKEEDEIRLQWVRVKVQINDKL